MHNEVSYYANRICIWTLNSMSFFEQKLVVLKKVTKFKIYEIIFQIVFRL